MMVGDIHTGRSYLDNENKHERHDSEIHKQRGVEIAASIHYAHSKSHRTTRLWMCPNCSSKDGAGLRRIREKDVNCPDGYLNKEETQDWLYTPLVV